MKRNLYPVIGHIFLIPSSQICCDRKRANNEISSNAFNDLIESILTYGLLEPILVRMVRPEEYTIVSGERRYFACVHAGLDAIPCVLLQPICDNVSALRLILHQQSLPIHYLDEARAIQALELPVPSAARLLNKPLQYVADKLKLLSLPHSVLDHIVKYQISEEIAQALTEADDDKREVILQFCSERRITPETLRQLLRSEQQGTRQARIVIFKDVNIFTNTIERVVSTMIQSGIHVSCDKTETTERISYQITIEKEASARFHTG